MPDYLTDSRKKIKYIFSSITGLALPTDQSIYPSNLPVNLANYIPVTWSLCPLITPSSVMPQGLFASAFPLPEDSSPHLLMANSFSSFGSQLKGYFSDHSFFFFWLHPAACVSFWARNQTCTHYSSDNTRSLNPLCHKVIPDHSYNVVVPTPLLSYCVLFFSFKALITS